MDPVSAVNVDQSSLTTPDVSINQSAQPGPDVDHASKKFRGKAALQLEARFLTTIFATEGLSVAMDGLSTAIRVAKEASDWNPFLKAALGGVVAVVELAKVRTYMYKEPHHNQCIKQTVSNNSQDMEDTLVRIQGLLPILETSAQRLDGRKDGLGKVNSLTTFA
ncbi:hypothetical protein H0H92_015317, partial [Tricholoma furcatifolium]